jgi:hypothetical protein
VNEPEQGTTAKTRTFSIPAPPSLDEDSESRIRSYHQAISERNENASGKFAEARRGALDWNLRFWLKIILFVVVIGMNVWWDWQVKEWIWQSGSIHGTFHLSDSVLVALATSSVANFLALILIVAKHLFPAGK